MCYRMACGDCLDLADAPDVSESMRLSFGPARSFKTQAAVRQSGRDIDVAARTFTALAGCRAELTVPIRRVVLREPSCRLG